MAPEEGSGVNSGNERFTRAVSKRSQKSHWVGENEPMQTNPTRERIKQMIVQHINPDLKPEELNDNTPLIGRGLGLDSVSLLELVVAIETDFGIRFDEKDMSPELFADVASITKYVEQKGNHKP